VAGQRADEVDQRGAEGVRRVGEVGERGIESPGRAHRAPRERLRELHVVVPGHGERAPGGDHPHRAREGVAHAGAPVGEVAEEDGATPLRVAPGAVGVRGVAERPEEQVQLRGATVHVADEVERAGVVATVGRERLALDERGVHLRGGAEHHHVPEPLALELRQRLHELVAVAAHHVRAHRPIRAGRGARRAQRLRQVEGDRRRRQVVAAGEREQRRARARRHVGGVDHREPPAPEPLGHDQLQHRERAVGGLLVARVVRHERAALVGRDHLGGREVARSEGGLARPEAPTSTTSEGAGRRIGMLCMAGGGGCGLRAVRRTRAGPPRARRARL
jgi:hypothetical protein